LKQRRAAGRSINQTKEAGNNELIAYSAIVRTSHSAKKGLAKFRHC
jgi:hypothetical protein